MAMMTMMMMVVMMVMMVMKLSLYLLLLNSVLNMFWRGRAGPVLDEAKELVQLRQVVDLLRRDARDLGVLAAAAVGGLDPGALPTPTAPTGRRLRGCLAAGLAPRHLRNEPPGPGSQEGRVRVCFCADQKCLHSRLIIVSLLFIDFMDVC